jgi:hypothetical protein
MRGIIILSILVGWGSWHCPAVDGTNSPSLGGDGAVSGLRMLLAHVAVADRVVATNWVGGGLDEKPFSISLSSDAMKKITNALSTARSVGAQEHPDFEWDWQLRFYCVSELNENVPLPT